MITAPIAVSLNEEQLSRFTGYPVTLPQFAGPLDLLLYLIRRQEIDIYDIPIARITGQFFDYMALMESLDIEVAAAIAPKAKIAVYFAPNTDRGFLDAIKTAVHDKLRGGQSLSATRTRFALEV